MIIATCDNCGKPMNLAEHLLKISPEGALIELLFAQMARAFRREFDVVYATEGEADVEALRLLLQAHKDSEERISAKLLAEIGAAWGRYLRKAGSSGNVSEFVYNWLPEENGDSSRVIPFRPRS